MSKLLKATELFLLVSLGMGSVACTSEAPVAEGTGQAEDKVSAVEPGAAKAGAPEGGEEGGEAGDYSAGEQANADFKDKLTGAELLNALKAGGHVIYFRHAQTDKDYADQADPKMSLADCESQRKLSDVGIQQAKDIGAAFVQKSIPVGDVITSEYCRAWKTAELAFAKYEKNPKLNFLPFEDYSDAQVAEMKANVMPLLTAAPESGKNTIIVGHDDIFEAATGFYPDPQGMAYVLTPDGKGGFTVQANLKPDEWAQL